LQPGDTYEVRDVQNYFGTPVATGTYSGGTISISLDNDVVSVPVSVPAGRGYPEHTDSEFNAFILLRTSGTGPPPCVPTQEICNGVDDDCDTLVDEDGVCTPPPTPTGNRFTFEAEDGTITAPLAIASDPTVSNGQYVYTGGAGYDGTLTFTFDVTEAADYVIWARVLAPNASADSFFVDMDGSQDIYDAAEGLWNGQWQWTQVTGRNGTGVPAALNPRTFSLATGNHNLIFSGREASSKIDVIHITTNLTFNPNTDPLPTGTGPGDINEDGTVDWLDINIITRHMFHSIQDLRADTDSNNEVDIFDLVRVAVNWGNVY
jgi:hypothetical protein